MLSNKTNEIVRKYSQSSPSYKTQQASKSFIPNF